MEGVAVRVGGEDDNRMEVGVPDLLVEVEGDGGKE